MTKLALRQTSYPDARRDGTGQTKIITCNRTWHFKRIRRVWENDVHVFNNSKRVILQLSMACIIMCEKAWLFCRRSKNSSNSSLRSVAYGKCFLFSVEQPMLSICRQKSGRKRIWQWHVDGVYKYSFVKHAPIALLHARSRSRARIAPARARHARTHKRHSLFITTPCVYDMLARRICARALRITARASAMKTTTTALKHERRTTRHGASPHKKNSATALCAARIMRAVMGRMERRKKACVLWEKNKQAAGRQTGMAWACMLMYMP